MDKKSMGLLSTAGERPRNLQATGLFGLGWWLGVLPDSTTTSSYSFKFVALGCLPETELAPPTITGACL